MTRFNPRPREGGDGADHQARGRLECFNPRPREGGDSGLEDRDSGDSVSIHAPVKGATNHTGGKARKG